MYAGINYKMLKVFTPAQAVFFKMMPYFFKSCPIFLNDALFFKICIGEELSQPTKHANKIIMSVFLIMKATILDTLT